MTAPLWRLELLGAPALTGVGRRVALLPRDAALLALLLLEGPQPAAGLAGLGWPGQDLDKAQNNLRQRLYRWRRDTGARLLEPGPRLARAADLAAHEWPALHTPADVDLAWLGSDTLDGLPELAERLMPHAAAWQQHVAQSLAAQAQAAEDAGDLDSALAWARPLADRDPIDEPAQRRLMRLHVRRGDRAAAMAVYDALRAALGEALGLRPSPETTALADAMAVAHAAPPVALRELPPGLLRPPQLIQREAERAALELGWASGRAIVIQGEAGIGKTRLMSEVLVGRPAVAVAQARPTDFGVALSTLSRLMEDVFKRHPDAVAPTDRAELARLLPELGAPAKAAGEAQRLLMLRALERSLARAMQQGLEGIALDDLHFADTASALALVALVECPALAPLRWLFARRAEPCSGGDRLCRALLESGRAETLVVPPLNREGLEAFVRSLDLPGGAAPGLAPALLQHTGGNPLFALETLRHLHAAGPLATSHEGLPLPGSVNQLIQLRLRTLSRPALELARLLAIAESAFSVALAEEVLGQGALRLADAWRELEDAQILRGHGYAHDLVAEALRQGLPPAIVERLHELVARHLAARGPPDARLARHWQRAGQPALALAAYRAAAAQARLASQHEVEVELLLSAEACANATGDAPARFEVASALVNAVRDSQGPEAALSRLSELESLAVTPRDGIRARIQRGEIAMDLQDVPSSLACCRDALKRLGRQGEPTLRFLAHTVLAQAWALAGRARRAAHSLRRAEALLCDAPTLDDRARLEGARSMVAFHSVDLHLGLRASQAVCDIARTQNNLTDLHRGLSNLAMVTLQTGDANAATQHAREAAQLSQKLGLGGLQRTVDQFNLGLTAIAAAHYDEALRSLEACLASPDAPPIWREHARTHLGVTWMHLGQYARAQKCLPDLDPAAAPHGVVRAARAAARVELARLTRSPRLAHTLAEALPLVTDSAGSGLLRPLLRLRQAQAAGPQAVLDEVAATLEATGGARQPAPQALRLILTVARACALMSTQRLAEALATARETVPSLAQHAIGFVYKPELMLDLADVIAAADDSAAAAAARRQTLDWIRTVARDHVPEPLRDAYLHRHPVHRRLSA